MTAVASLPHKLQEQLKRDSIFHGAGPSKIRHLVPPHNLKLEGTPLWMTRCGIEWPDGPWYQAVSFTDSESGQHPIPWCEACLKQAGLKQVAKSDELYELAVREWIARRLSSSERKYTAADVSDVRYGVDYGFEGSDVTPADEPEASIRCKVRGRDHVEMASGISPVKLVVQCLQIVEELRVQPR